MEKKSQQNLVSQEPQRVGVLKGVKLKRMLASKTSAIAMRGHLTSSFRDIHLVRPVLVLDERLTTREER